MQRKWYVWPHPETGVVERGDLVDALVDAAAVLDRIGGVLGVVQERVATGAPGEMRSTVIVIEWKDRTDAKEQPERPAQTMSRAESMEEALRLGHEVDAAEEHAADEPEPVLTEERYAEAARDSVGDGLDEAELEEEDLSSVPEHAR